MPVCSWTSAGCWACRRPRRRASATAFIVWPQPVTLVLIGAVGQGLMLPVLAGAAVYFRHRRLPPDLAPSLPWTIALWTSALLIALVGAYQLYNAVR